MKDSLVSPFTDSQVHLRMPQGANFLVWLSHDVDRVYKTFFHCLYYAYQQRKMSHISNALKGYNPYWSFQRILDVESKLGVKSTFFFLNESMSVDLCNPKSFVLAKGRYNILDKRVQNVIREIDHKGWEIGLHGSYNSYCQKELLANEKQVLEDIIGHPILGIRQHYLNLNIPQTWEIHRSLGLKYDASFGLTKMVGFRDDIYYPFRPFQDDFIVFPMTIMDNPLFKKFKYPHDTWNQCVKLIEMAAEKKTILSILWHNQVFDEHDYPGYETTYIRLIKECQARGGYFCMGKNIQEFLIN